MNPHFEGMGADIPLSSVPVLRSVIAPSELPEHALAQLEARMAARAHWMALGPSVAEALRPELERLMADLVRRNVQEAWREHCLAANWTETGLGHQAP